MAVRPDHRGHHAALSEPRGEQWSGDHGEAGLDPEAGVRVDAGPDGRIDDEGEVVELATRPVQAAFTLTNLANVDVSKVLASAETTFTLWGTGAGRAVNIKTAAKRIDIADPYLTDPEVIAHLCAAARRGVDVHVVLPKTNIHAYEQIAERAHYNEMLSAGVNVYGHLFMGRWGDRATFSFVVDDPAKARAALDAAK